MAENNSVDELIELSNKRYHLIFNDDFNGKEIDKQKWIPYYLPHWSSRKMSAASYSFDNSNITLKINSDKRPSHLYTTLICSSIQTGEYAGDLGTSIGLHRYNDTCIVREEQENILNHYAFYGYYEIKAKFSIGGGNHVAWWAVGYETTPDKSGEIDILEILGRDVKKNTIKVGHGIHPWKDKNLKEEYYWDEIYIDTNEYHIYGFEWNENDLKFFIDYKFIRVLNQSLKYPVVFLFSIYESTDKEYWTGPYDPLFPYPKTFKIDYFRAYKLI